MGATFLASVVVVVGAKSCYKDCKNYDNCGNCCNGEYKKDGSDDNYNKCLKKCVEKCSSTEDFVALMESGTVQEHCTKNCSHGYLCYDCCADHYGTGNKDAKKCVNRCDDACPKLEPQDKLAAKNRESGDGCSKGCTDTNNCKKCCDGYYWDRDGVKECKQNCKNKCPKADVSV